MFGKKYYSTILNDDQGTSAGLTEIRRQEALLKTGALQNAIFNSANFSSIATDEKGVIQIFNVGAERMLGYISRWLLFTLDRLPRNELTMTQELIANMLGMRRERVVEAAGNLHSYGYISYRRGHITVVNRAGLERDMCECYDVVKKEFARLLSDVRQRQDRLETGALRRSNA